MKSQPTLVLDRVLRVLQPLVRLLLRNGVTYTVLAGALKRVFGPATITAGGSGTPATVFEGATTTYTATLTNSSGAATGSFESAVVFTNGTVTGVSCTSAHASSANRSTSPRMGQIS